MKKLGLGILIISLVLIALVVSGVGAKATAKPNPATGKAFEPLDKITFIHYKDGTVRGMGGSAKLPTCYKLLGVKWKTLPIGYVINPDGYNQDFVVGAIAGATAEWDSHTSVVLFGSSEVDFGATWDDTSDEVDYQNEYVFGVYPDNNVIAVTNTWYTRFSRQIVDYDVLFNTYYNWFDCEKTTCDKTNKGMDLQNIAIHETGHGIGLADIYNSTCSTATMYGYSDYGEIIKRTLEQPDITGLQKLYGF